MRYRALVYDIGKKSMTLLARPLLPRARHYLVSCDLAGEAHADFHVCEVQRILLTRRKQHFLRVGLRVLDTDHTGLGLLGKIEDHLFQLEDTDGRETNAPASRRFGERTHFQLPAYIRLDGKIFRCQTIDMNPQGIGVLAPVQLPFAQSFNLSFLDPAGREVQLLVQETNRLTGTVGTGEVRLGVQVIGGTAAYRRFLRKHSTSIP